MTAQLNPDDYLNLSAVYALLSQLWEHEVTLELLEQINEPQLKSSLTKLGAYVPEEVSQAVVDELAIDYCQLLVGPKNHIIRRQIGQQEQLYSRLH